MTDVSFSLKSFQQAIRANAVDPHPSATDRNLLFHVDRPGAGVTRLTFARMKGKTVTAMVMFTQVQHYEGKPCYQIGYAVPERYQKQGRAKEIVAAAIKEFTSGMKRHEPEFYIEAIIDAENKASQRVAEQLISGSPKEITDKIAGVPALQYLKHIK